MTFEEELTMAEKRGRKEGIDIGVRQGREEGIEIGIGIRLGREMERVNIALNMLKKGLDIYMIAEVTELLSLEEIQKLKKNS